MRLLRMILLGLSAGAMVMPGAVLAQTQTLVDVATISMSAPGMPRTVTNTVCATDGNDLVCDRGVYITSSSWVGIGNAKPIVDLHIIKAGTGGGIAAFTASSTTGQSGLYIFSYTRDYPTAYLRDTAMVYAPGNTSHLQLTAVSSTTGSIRFTVGDFDKPTSEYLRIDNAGRIGVGLHSRTASTTLHVSGSLRLATEASATLAVCDADRTGAIRYTGGDFSFCRNGSAWEPLSSLGGGGVSKLASLTDVVTSGAVSGSVLAYNAATSSWTALPIQQVMSTTTMLTGWPDALRCSGANGHTFFDLLYTNGNSFYWYRLRGDYGGDINNTPQISFASNGAVNSISYLGNWTNWMADCASKSIAQHYATGTAYNFIGTANASGSTVLGDRITSGSSAVVVNSATGIVSITQLGAVASYVHPSIGFVGPGVSTTGAVSTSRVYLSATANQCATAADIGSMFRSATTGKLQICADRN